MSDPLDYDDEIAIHVPSGPAPAPPPSRIMANTTPSTWLEGLNEAQLEAVETIDGPLLVLAGAGTGKTRVLTTRLAQIMHLGRARHYQMLVVTFTNKAAREMHERVTRLVGLGVEGMWLGTFHALASKILRRHAELVGLQSNFTILDTDDQIRLLKQVMVNEAIDEKRWPARMLISVIQRWKDKDLTPERVTPSDAGEIANGRIVAIYKNYQARLETLNAADFGDLLLHNLTLFRQHPDILEKYQSLFHYILVDEYQDTNVSQYLWLRLLAQKNKNICCVGDDDQSIYGWRGAEVGNILKFEKDFSGAKIVRLELNYRSTGHILAAASGIIAKNQGRLGKTLWTDGEDGELVHIRGVWDGGEEAKQVGEEIEFLKGKKHNLSDMAVLVRAGYQTREFEERFMALGVPYKVIGGARFYEREEIRDAIAYLRVIHQPADDLALERIINKPTRGIGKTTLQAMHQVARLESVPLFIAAQKLLATDDLKTAAKRSLAAIIDSFHRWREMSMGLSHVDHVKLAETILEESGYIDFWRNSKKPEALGKVENLKELRVALEDHESLASFLEHVSLVMENEKGGEDTEMLSIMTLHGAKGLEFDSIFLPGWEEGLFPSQRTMDENGMAGLEEERRLAYVGITRARQRVYISFAANRRIHGKWQSAIPSRFIDELPNAHVEVEADRGLYSGPGGGRAEERTQYGLNAHGGDNIFGNGQGHSSLSWQRMKHSKNKTLQGGAKSMEKKHSFKEGDRCFHQKFGPGDVIAIDGDHLSIEFDKAGRKKVVASFVEKPS